MTRKTKEEKEQQQKDIVANVLDATDKRIRSLDRGILFHQDILLRLLDEKTSEQQYMLSIYKHGIDAITDRATKVT
jgi:hypothetical protein